MAQPLKKGNKMNSLNFDFKMLPFEITQNVLEYTEKPFKAAAILQGVSKFCYSHFGKNEFWSKKQNRIEIEESPIQVASEAIKRNEKNLDELKAQQKLDRAVKPDFFLASKNEIFEYLYSQRNELSQRKELNAKLMQLNIVSGLIQDRGYKFINDEILLDSPCAGDHKRNHVLNKILKLPKEIVSAKCEAYYYENSEIIHRRFKKFNDAVAISAIALRYQTSARRLSEMKNRWCESFKLIGNAISS